MASPPVDTLILDEVLHGSLCCRPYRSQGLLEKHICKKVRKNPSYPKSYPLKGNPVSFQDTRWALAHRNRFQWLIARMVSFPHNGEAFRSPSLGQLAFPALSALLGLWYRRITRAPFRKVR